MTAVQPALLRAAESVTVLSPFVYRINTPRGPLTRNLVSFAGDTPEKETVLNALAVDLYVSFYCSSPTTDSSEPVAFSEDPAFVAALSAANCGQGNLDADWRIVRRGADGHIEASRYGLTVWALPDEVAPQVPNLPDNSLCRIKLPKEFRGMSPGFYMALGDAPTEDRLSSPRESRFYFNLRAQGAVEFMRIATTLLNAAGTPFRLKVGNHPDSYDRTDAAVLYVSLRTAAGAGDVLEHLYSRVAPFLDDECPAYTLCLAPGLGCADDPATGESFGQHRSRLVASALLLASGSNTPDDIRSRVAATFAAAGLDAARPHLSPPFHDVYQQLSQRKWSVIELESHRIPHR